MLSVVLPSCHSNPPFSQICKSHLFAIAHHVAHPGDCLVHLTHMSSIQMIPAAKSGERLDGPSCGKTCQQDGILSMFKVGSRHASCLDDAVVLGWVADVPPAGDCTAASLSLASLDQGWLGHSIQVKVCVTFTV